MSRKRARVGQMQILYQMDLTKDYSLDNLELFLDNFNLLDEEVHFDEKNDVFYVEDEINYIKETIPELIENMEEIDLLIDKNLEGWTIDRLSKVDKEILRIAVYEFLYREDIPAEVSINEAVEIAKNFGGNNSSKFVNGILGSIYRTLKEEE